MIGQTEFTKAKASSQSAVVLSMKLIRNCIVEVKCDEWNGGRSGQVTRTALYCDGRKLVDDIGSG